MIYSTHILCFHHFLELGEMNNIAPWASSHVSYLVGVKIWQDVRQSGAPTTQTKVVKKNDKANFGAKIGSNFSFVKSVTSSGTIVLDREMRWNQWSRFGIVHKLLWCGKVLAMGYPSQPKLTYLATWEAIK